jgi:hypothetical protein
VPFPIPALGDSVWRLRFRTARLFENPSRGSGLETHISKTARCGAPGCWSVRDGPREIRRPAGQSAGLQDDPFENVGFGLRPVRQPAAAVPTCLLAQR